MAVHGSPRGGHPLAIYADLARETDLGAKSLAFVKGIVSCLQYLSVCRRKVKKIMNFLGIVKGIGKGLGFVGTVAGAGLTVVNPALGALVSKISNAVITAEAQIPEDKQGPAKQQMVIDDFNQSLAFTQALFKAGGKLMTYDMDALNKVIKLQADTFNAYAELGRSIKLVDHTPSAPVPIQPFGLG